MPTAPAPRTEAPQAVSTPSQSAPSDRLLVALLGVPVVTWAERPLPIARRQTRALLYRLATDGAPLTRAQLCFLFWPDIPDTTARRNLTRLLVLVRGALP